MSKPVSRDVRRRENRWFRWLAAPLVAFLIRMLTRTLRISLFGQDRLERVMRSQRPAIFVFWHEDLFGIAAMHLRINQGLPFKRPVAVMISRSRDGEMLASVVERLNIAPIRGSSSRGGLGALIEMAHWLKSGEGSREPAEEAPMVALALDGPRGPRREAKPGAALLAKKTNALIIPIAFCFSSQWTFKSWDKTKLAKPWSRMACYIEEPIDAAQSADQSGPEMDAAAKALQLLCERMEQHPSSRFSKSE